MCKMLQDIQVRLEDITHRMGLVSAALATEDGLLLAASGGGIDPELLAAVSPLWRELPENQRKEQMIRYEAMGMSLQVFDWPLGDQSIFLCTAGAAKVDAAVLQDHLRFIAQMMEA